MRDNNIKNKIEQEWPSAKSLTPYNIVSDTTFTRDKTGVGSIEYFDGIHPVTTYPNGFQYRNPYNTPSIVYDPNSNSINDIKVDLLHHYRNSDPIYNYFLSNYSNALKEYANSKDNTSWVAGDAIREWKEFGSPEDKDHFWNNAIDGSLRALLYGKNDKERILHRYPSYNESLNYLPNKETMNAFNDLKEYLHSTVLPTVDITAPRKYQEGGYMSRLDTQGLMKDPEYIQKYNWRIYPKNLSVILDSLIARKASYPQRIAVLSQVIPESGGNTASHGNGAHGLVGWRGGRAKNLSDNIQGLAHKLMTEIYDDTRASNWTHGGKGTNINTGKEMREFFINTNNVRKATNAFMRGYVRPPEEDREERLLFLNLLKKYMK